MRKLLPGLIVACLLATHPVQAQGTQMQRAACERDSHRLCAEAEPDAIAVEKCLQQHIARFVAGLQKTIRRQGAPMIRAGRGTRTRARFYSGDPPATRRNSRVKASVCVQSSGALG